MFPFSVRNISMRDCNGGNGWGVTGTGISKKDCYWIVRSDSQ
jgi:hypothetical protein